MLVNFTPSTKESIKSAETVSAAQNASTITMQVYKSEALELEEIQEEKRQQEEKERAELEFVERCKKFLTPVSGYDPKATKKNILAFLKYRFKGVKFTARRASGCVCVSWTDGPTPKEVRAVCNNFVDHEFDVTGDYNDYKPNLFTKTFGGIEYSVDTNRTYSNDILNATIKEIKEVHPEFTEGYDSYKRVTITKESKFISYYNIVTWGSFNLQEVVNGYLNSVSFYEEPGKRAATVEAATTDATATDGSNQEATTTATNDTNESEGLTLVQYSEKAVAIIGNTFPVKEQLKKLGGRFNARLTCGAGWVFSRKRENELRAALDIA